MVPTWTGNAGGGDCNNPANWTDGRVPQNGDVEVRILSLPPNTDWMTLIEPGKLPCGHPVGCWRVDPVDESEQCGWCEDVASLQKANEDLMAALDEKTNQAAHDGA